MSVSLVAITKGVNQLEDHTAEEVISFVARVSNPSNQLNFDSAPKLLDYCIKHSHWSVFETSFMTVQIETSRAIAAQILRHRTFTFQEYSQRYSKAVENTWNMARRQDKKNKQNSIDDLSDEVKKWFLSAQEEVWNTSFALYEKALELGVAKESARFLLPLSTKTTLYMTGSARSWIHYIQVRAKENGTQEEHADIALRCKKIFCKEFPNIAKAQEWI